MRSCSSQGGGTPVPARVNGSVDAYACNFAWRAEWRASGLHCTVDAPIGRGAVQLASAGLASDARRWSTRQEHKTPV